MSVKDIRANIAAKKIADNNCLSEAKEMSKGGLTLIARGDYTSAMEMLQAYTKAQQGKNPLNDFTNHSLSSGGMKTIDAEKAARMVEKSMEMQVRSNGGMEF